MHVLRNQLNVFQALIIRDLMSRHGRHHLGFIWTVLEPMLLCSGVMIVWSQIHEPVIHGIPIIAFVVTGYMPLTLWRHLTNPMPKILRASSGLLYHRPISPIHVILARSILEFLSTSAALGLIYFGLVSTGVIEPIQDPGLALAGWLFVAWYHGALGLLIAACTEYWEPAEKFIQPIQYFALPLSGAFFMVDWMPDYGQKLLLYNPVVNCFEMFRAGFLGASFTTHYYPWYMAATSLAMTVVGAAAVYRVRDHIQYT